MCNEGMRPKELSIHVVKLYSSPSNLLIELSTSGRREDHPLSYCKVLNKLHEAYLNFYSIIYYDVQNFTHSKLGIN